MRGSGVSDYLELVQIPADKDCVKVAAKWSQVCTIIILPLGARKPSDWTDKDDWDEVIKNDALNNEYGRLINCIGGVEEATPLEIPSGLKVKTVGYQKQLIADIPITHDWQYSLLQRIQLGQINFSFWFGTLDGRLIGGANGIQPRKVFADTIYAPGTGEFEKGIIKFDWSEGAVADRYARIDLPELVNPGLPIEPITPPYEPDTAISDDTGTLLTDDTGTVLF